jgi:predicted DNA-binding transcriptional regulator YafY
VKGQDIADRFNISLRTAYRDIRALEESGVPIVSEAGVGYSLMDGYKLPPVMFTKEEAIAFLTAEKLIEKFTDPSTFEVYQSALYKIKAVLRSDDKDHVEKMDSYIEVIGNQYIPQDKRTSNFIQLILKSVAQKNVLSIDYFANHNQQSSSRSVEPLGIFLLGEQWHLIAFCWLRNDYRNFRIDRISKCQMTDQPFKKEHPSLKTYLAQITRDKKELYTVVMRIDNDKYRFLGEQKYYNGFVSEKKLGDCVEMTFLTSSIEGFARWYMMFGDCAEIIKPPALKKRIREIYYQIREKVN